MTDIVPEPTTTTTRDRERGEVACRVCGVGITHPAVVSRQSVDRTHSGNVIATAVVTLSLCGACAALDATAGAIVAAHPGLGRFWPQPEVRHERVLGVLAACALLGRTRAPRAADSPAALGVWLHRLAVLGGGVTWAGLLTWSRADMVATGRWSGIDPATRARLVDGYARALGDLRDLTRPPVRVGPPTADRAAPPGAVIINGACAYCGVDGVDVPALDLTRRGLAEVRHATWTPVQRPRWVGWLCPACTDAVERNGSPGHGSVVAAVGLYLGAPLPLHPGDSNVLASPYADNVVAGDPVRPGATPWAHLGSPDGLRAEFVRYAATGDARPVDEPPTNGLRVVDASGRVVGRVAVTGA